MSSLLICEWRPARDELGGRPFRRRLINLYREKFGEHIPLVRRQDVKGFITRKPLWLAANLPVAMIRREVEMMEDEARNFYQAAIAQTSDAAVRQLLGDLAAEESIHYDLAEKWMRSRKPPVQAMRKMNPSDAGSCSR